MRCAHTRNHRRSRFSTCYLFTIITLKNNFYELAYETVCGFLQQNGIVIGKHVAVGLAKREGVTGVYSAV